MFSGSLDYQPPHNMSSTGNAHPDMPDRAALAGGVSLAALQSLYLLLTRLLEALQWHR